MYDSPQNVSLSTATQGASIYYTLNGNNPTRNSLLYSGEIAINETTTLKAIAVKDGLNDSGVLTEEYIINGGDPKDIAIDLPNFGVPGVTASLVVPEAAGEPATLTLGSDSAPYPNQASAGTINDIHNQVWAALQAAGATTALAGRDLNITFKSSTSVDLPLLYVHNLREAMGLAGAGASGKVINVTAPADKFTPTLDGRDLWSYGNGGVPEQNSFYNYYEGRFGGPTAEIELMNGITLKRTGTNPVRYGLEYNRDMKVSRLVWQSVNDGFSDVDAPFDGFGLSKGTNGTLSPMGGNWNNVKVSTGYTFEDETVGIWQGHVRVNDLSYYLTELGKIDLHPFIGGGTRPLVDHSKVAVQSAGADSNVMANGMYDFVLAYYNPDGNNEFGDGRVENQDLLPSWPASGITFDGLGLPADITSRNIGGTVANNMVRKGEGPSGTPISGTGRPNDDFIGSITVPMANFMRTDFGITEFSNTNIVGDGDRWNGTNSVVLPRLINVGLLGDYDNISVNYGGSGMGIRGVLDIFGKAPLTIDNNDEIGYLNLWNITGNMGINKFSVVAIRNALSVQYVNTGNPWAANAKPANVVIYPEKYNSSAISNESLNLKPEYRAFMSGNDGTGTARIVPVDASFTNAASYKGTVASTTGSVYPLDEQSWIEAANANNGAGAAPSSIPYTDSNAPVMTLSEVSAFAGLATSP